MPSYSLANFLSEIRAGDKKQDDSYEEGIVLGGRAVMKEPILCSIRRGSSPYFLILLLLHLYFLPLICFIFVCRMHFDFLVLGNFYVYYWHVVQLLSFYVCGTRWQEVALSSWLTSFIKRIIQGLSY